MPIYDDAAFQREIYGNDQATIAQVIAPNSVTTGSLTVGDRDWFLVTLTDNEPLSLRLQSSTAGEILDTMLYLYDSSGKLIEANDDRGGYKGPAYSSLINQNLGPGAYYVVVGTSGDRIAGGYQLIASTIPPHTTFDASTLGDDQPAGSHLVAANSTTNGVLERQGDADWHQLTLSQRTSISILLRATGTSATDVPSWGNVSDTMLYLYDASGRLIESNDDGGTGDHSSAITRTLDAGTYRIVSGMFDDRQVGSISYQLQLKTGSRALSD